MVGRYTDIQVKIGTFSHTIQNKEMSHTTLYD
jgi:hypothetical protein